jgi:phage/plasmid primase-like uncharacterized protein
MIGNNNARRTGHEEKNYFYHTSKPPDSQALRKKLLDVLPPIPTTNLKTESNKSYCGPCPKCGGDDRFVFKTDVGRFLCRNCHQNQGDFVEYHCWLGGLSFGELCEKHLGHNGSKQADHLSYLITERKISNSIVEKYAKAGKLFSIDYNGKPAVGAVYSTLEGKTTDSGGAKVMQFIPTDGDNKKFKSGCKASEPFFFIVGDPKTASEIIIAESVINALTVETVDQAAAAVAIGSSTYTRKLEALKPYKEKVVLAFDNDDAGRKATKDAVNILGGCCSIRWSHDDPDGCDINDLLKAGQNDRVVDMIIEAMPMEPEAGEPEKENQENKIGGLETFSLFGRSKDMEKELKESVFVLDKIALLGQSTVLYAPPNTGKTLLALWLLMDSIKTGRIKGEDLFYINADDTFEGLVYKLKIAEQYGFHMIAPGYQEFKPELLVTSLTAMVEAEKSNGKIVVLDTVKKFTDIMSKRDGKEFGLVIRNFVSKGGTVIGNAHTNKNRDGERKLVYAGTTDIMEDSDCAYIIDRLEETETRRKVVFENTKNRGPVSLKIIFEYDHRPGTPYHDRLDSIREIPLDEHKKIELKNKLKARFEKNREAVDAIVEALLEGTNKKTQLIKAAAEKSDLTSGTIKKALREHTGNNIDDFQFWRLNIGNKNSNIYHLNFGYEQIFKKTRKH